METSTVHVVRDTFNDIVDKALSSEDVRLTQTKSVVEEIKSEVGEGIEPGKRTAEFTKVLTDETTENEIHDSTAEIKSGTDLNDNQYTDDINTIIITKTDDLNQAAGTLKDDVKHILAERTEEAVDSVENKVFTEVSDLQEDFNPVTDPVRTKLFTSYQEGKSHTESNGLDPMVDSSAHETENGGSSTLETAVKVVTTVAESIQSGATVEETAKAVCTEVIANKSIRFSPELSPLTETKSTESRDNPFIPDGELSKETDELLKRATIIRDKFILDQQERKEKGLDSTDNVNPEKSPVQESIVAPVSAQAAHAQAKGSQPATAEVKPRMRENGKVEDSVSPEGVKAEVDKGAAAPNTDGSKTSPEASGDNDKEKKKQKKCCSIM